MIRVAGALAAGVAFGLLATAGAAGAVTTTAVDPNDALLSTRQMPVVNEVQDWERVPNRHTRVSTAQPTSLRQLGATDKARRDFALPGASASSVVLTFAGVDEAKRAYTQVRGWRFHTGDRVPEEGKLLYTSELTPVEVEEGRGAYFAFVFKRDRAEEEGTFEWLGVTRRGNDVSIVAWRVDGTDATYEVDPTIASVRTANKKLARLG